jgi:chemotaxis protein MotB
MSESNTRPIIIKRRVVKGGGHHGGAWKVAYADFVTAMMAFFLMMWLINATSEEQKGGIADYFSPDVPMSERSTAGDGMLGGESLMTSENLADDRGDTEFTQMQVTLAEQLDASAVPGEMTQHLLIYMTDDGLVIEIVDIDGRELFESGSAVPSTLLRRIVAAIAPVIGQARNRIGVSGHTDSIQFSGGSYDNWELSSDRANVMRRLMRTARVPANRFVSVEGRADTEPLSRDRDAAENRRVSVTLFHASRHPLAPADTGNQPN